MATFYIQLEDRLQKISGDLTHDNIVRALGYTPSDFSGNFNDLINNPLTQDGNEELKIVDESGNIIAIVNSEGIHSIDFIAGNHKLSDKTDKTYVDEAIKNVEVDLTGYATEEYVNNIDFYNINNNPIIDGEENSLTFVDENGNIGLKVTENGLYVKDVIANEHTLSQKADKSELNKKQDALVSGTNIKTVNGQSLLGNGDLEVQEFKTYTFDYNNYTSTITQEELNKILESDKIYIKNNDILIEVTVKEESDSNLFLIGYNNSLEYVREYHVNIDKNNLTLFMLLDDAVLITDSELEDFATQIYYNELITCPYIEDGLVLENQFINTGSASKIIILPIYIEELSKIFYLYSSSIGGELDVYNITFSFYGKYTDTSLLKATYNVGNQTLIFNIIELSGNNIDLSNYATEDYVNQKEQAIQTWVNNKEFATQEEIANIDFYDIKNNPIINNGDGKLIFADEQGNIGLQLEADNTLYVKDVIAGDNILSNKADKSELPTNISELENDKGYITSAEIPSLDEYVKSENLPNFEEFAKTKDIPSLEGYAKTEDIPSLEGYAKLEDIPEVPEIPSLDDYVTEIELNNKGFLTEHQDISGKQDKLISGENLKTINGESLLGKGNIIIEGGNLSKTPIIRTTINNEDCYVEVDTKTYITCEGSANIFLNLYEDDGYVHSYEIVLLIGGTTYSISFPNNIKWIKPLTITKNTRYNIIIEDNIATWVSIQN